jgi:hypothetical protein
MKRIVALCLIIIAASAVIKADTIFYNRSFEAEKAVDAWAQKAQFGYGYESDYDISHFYSLGVESGSALNAKAVPQAEISKYFDTVAVETIKEMYIEFYGNDAAIKYLIRYYKSKKDWRNINHFVKKIEPGTSFMFNQLQTYVKNSPRCASFANDAVLLRDTRRRAFLCQRERLTIIEDYP